MSHVTSDEWTKWDLIHPSVYQSLKENNFNNPTDIQAYVLNCYRNHNDFLIASQTGSGKTLSFGIPIVSEIIYDKTGAFKDSTKNPKHGKKYIRCLIIVPTRELVLQIEKHLNQISQNAKNYIRVGSLVGGISKEKQRRVLSYVPDILIATPGRLWDMIDNYEHECLDNLHLLDYLVLDEADRMVELGHFDELDKILEKVYNKGELVENKGEIKQINDLIAEKKTKNIQLKTKAPLSIKALESIGEDEVLTISGDEAKKFFANLKNNNQLDQRELKGMNVDAFDEDEQINSTQDNEDEENNSEDDEEIEGDEDELEGDDDELEGEEDELEGDEDLEDEELSDDDEEEADEEILQGEDDENEDIDEEEDLENEDEENIDGEDKDLEESAEDQLDVDEGDKPKKNAKMKVFLVSATLTKQFAGNKHKIKIVSKKEKKKLNKERKDRKKGKIDKEQEKEEKMIPKMEALMNKIKFSAKYKVIDLTQTILIPKNLKELKTVCVEEDKPLYLYHYILERPDESFIVFTNSITYAKKIVHLLQIIGLRVLCMHSEMQQRQRLKKLDQFKNGEYKILISTDVSARGLDIPSVQNVIHYQVPMDVDTYIHRSGRTARIGKAGTCYTLVGPKDGLRFQKIINQLEKEQGIQNIEINHTERDKIRVLIESAQSLERSDFLVRQKQLEKAWYSKNSKLVDCEVDEEIKQELTNINEELVKKRQVMKKDRVEFKKIREDVKQVHRRTNNMFLEPAQIQKYAERMEKLSELKDKPKQKKQYPQQDESHKGKGKFDKKFNKFNKSENNDNKKFNKPGNKNENNKFNKKRRHSQR